MLEILQKTPNGIAPDQNGAPQYCHLTICAAHTNQVLSLMVVSST
jgi:hypothetical protein